MAKPAFIDDKYQHLESDIDKMRVRFRQYISYSNEEAAMALFLEVLLNALDEVKNPRSPADKIMIEFDERSGFMRVTDNGRGIPTDQLELLLSTLNSGSNLDSSDKTELKTDVTGQNGVGTLAYRALSERVEVISYRGGTENVFKRLVFAEGIKIEEDNGRCDSSKHGMEVYFKPSKILGKRANIVWSQVHNVLTNIQFLEKKKITISSDYIDSRGNKVTEKYKTRPFVDILKMRNSKDIIIGDYIFLTVEADNIPEEIGGKKHKRFMSLDIAFVPTSSMTPYIDSFSNSNNTVDNGHHLDGVTEAICRFFQQVTKSSLSEKEKDKLDIKWDDVKNGLSLAIALRTNIEHLYTGQTKHKVVNEDLRVLIRDTVMEDLQRWATKNPNQLKDLINIVKMNAKVRREGEKVRSAVIKESITNWSSFRMKNYDPCSNRGKEYKELYIIEGDSAKGSLKLARDPKFQALFAIRGVSANVFKLDLNGILANREFNDLIKVMGCNVGSKFDLSKLVFDKIIIATDADIDGLFIRTLLLSFFFKVFPEVIQDGRLFIAEPPLYRVNDKKNPFVINREDYINRYINDVTKNYQLGFGDGKTTPQFMVKQDLKSFLSDTSSYASDISLLADHYKVNERLIEIIINEFAMVGKRTKNLSVDGILANIKIQDLINEIGLEFNELYYDDTDMLIKGSIDGKFQSMELSERLVRKSMPLINMIVDNNCLTTSMVIREIKSNSLESYPLLTVLKLLQKYQPDVVHRFKGLGENRDEDIKTTIMDPNRRLLIRVNISTIENDMKVFNVLRGSSPLDAKARKLMMREYTIDKDMIDT